jgi:acyl-[acyl carrier protein]--UDP-N-acetylglucosamine O-acyltransferase
LIDPRAIIDPSARIGEDVEIGPWTIIGPDVEVGDRCSIASHVVLKGRARTCVRETAPQRNRQPAHAGVLRAVRAR